MVFLDLRKAFDSVKRSQVVEAIQKAGLSPYLSNAAANLLTCTTMVLNGNTIETTIGVPQGAVTSPTYFSLVINNLVRQLNQNGNLALAFADDIVLVCKGDKKLRLARATIDNWAANSGIAVNNNKSMLLVIRADRRTPAPYVKTEVGTKEDRKEIEGFQVTKAAKFLGLCIDDDGKFRAAVDDLKAREQKFKRQINMQWGSKLTPRLQWLAWRQLIFSRFQYAVHLLTPHSTKIFETLQGQWYRSIKKLLQIKQ